MKIYQLFLSVVGIEMQFVVATSLLVLQQQTIS